MTAVLNRLAAWNMGFEDVLTAVLNRLAACNMAAGLDGRRAGGRACRTMARV